MFFHSFVCTLEGRAAHTVRLEVRMMKPITRSQFLRVVLTRRLPNVDVPDQVPGDLCSYGRFGYTASGEFFLTAERTSHPMDTREGGYYGLSRDFKTLYLSPRGASINFGEFANDGTIRKVCQKLGLKDLYRHFKIQERTAAAGGGTRARRMSDAVSFSVGA